MNHFDTAEHVAHQPWGALGIAALVILAVIIYADWRERKAKAELLDFIKYAKSKGRKK